MFLRNNLFLAALLMGCLHGRAELVIVADSETTLPIVEVKSLSWMGNFSTGSLVVNYADGQQLTIPFSQITKLTMKPDEVEVEQHPTTEDEQDGDPTKVQSVASDKGVSASVSGDYLMLDGVSAKDVVAIFNTVGKCVTRFKAASCISLHGLPAGTYVAHVGGHSVKFIKR